MPRAPRSVAALALLTTSQLSSGSPVNPAIYQFSLSKYPTNGPTVAQFPDDHSRIYSRGKYYIRLYVRTSIKCTFKMRSPIGRISDSAFYATRAEADREVLGHRCLIEGLEKHGEEWFVPASSPAAKVKNISIDAEVVAIERNIKSLRIAIEDKANRIQSLETQLRTERSTLATLEAVVLTRNFIILLFCLYEPKSMTYMTDGHEKPENVLDRNEYTLRDQGSVGKPSARELAQYTWIQVSLQKANEIFAALRATSSEADVVELLCKLKRDLR